MATPNIVFREFTVSGTTPIGERAQNTHPSFNKVLGTDTDKHLSFGDNNITNSGVYSATKVVVGHMDSSGDLTTQLFNMRFWLSSVRAFNQGTVRFNQQRTGVWVQNNVVTNSSTETTPTSLPGSGNLLRYDGVSGITGSGDSQVTEYIYLSIYTGTDVPVGAKGGAGQNTFRYRLTCDYY